MLRLLKSRKPSGAAVPEEEYRVSRILADLLATTALSFVVFIVIRLSRDDYRTVAALGAGLLALGLAGVLLGLGRFKTSLFVIALSALAVLTAVCTMGQGLHDISIVAYPTIVILSSLAMQRRRFLVFLVLAVGCVAWLALGESRGIFRPLPHGPGDVYDVIVVSIVLGLTALLADRISDSMRKALRTAQAELEERRKAEEEIARRLREKESLIREVHHRVKNNLSVISSLLNLQAGRITSTGQAVQAFLDTRSRIQAMALVHEKLYRSGDLSHIEFGEYIGFMVENLKRLYASGGRIRIRLDSDGARLDVQTAVPLGMILNEIVTNAMKHAFNGRESGEVSIALRRSPDGALALSVRDDGVGLPAHVDMENPASFGLELVTLLAQQIGAWVSVSTGSGTCFSVQVPPPKPDPRLPAAAETEPAAG